ncbi:phytolongin Phyl1.1-like [Momordica charantia]|uniref:Phytolongin Phyl1.1-like n=1 Tax=Momordica charantia TaxID=3673 RepID=A0A6J1DG35_MOMCH|nr:phytolongin Phyl1.1-like [Momordica charantia]
MDPTHSKIYYCSVSRGERMLHVYSSGDQEIENLATLCLKSAPPYHKWYFETLGKKTFGFLMKEGYIYFAIAGEVVGNRALLQFLEQLRDEFKKAAKKGSRGSFSSVNSISLQEQLVPAIRNLITSLENVTQSSKDWIAETPSSNNALSPSPSNMNGQVDVSASTKAPLLGKPSKPEKKKGKDHVITMRGIEMEEHRKSTDRGSKTDSASLESSNLGGSGSSIPVQKDLNPLRRSNSQSIRIRWWRHVRIALAVDAAVCLILFVIWLIVCNGISCVR